MANEFFEWEDGEEVQGETSIIGYVVINGEQLPVYAPKIEGNTPLTAYNMNQMQNTIKTYIDDKVIDNYSSSYFDRLKSYSVSYINGNNNYSQGEIFTGKTWIDSKPIYRKVFNLGMIGSQTDIDIVVSCDTVVHFDGFIQSSTDVTKEPLIFRGTERWRNITYTVDTTNNDLIVRIRRDSTSSWSNWYLIVIVEYTKPDEAN